MFDWLLLLQVLVTLLIAPLFSYQRYRKVSEHYAISYSSAVQNEVLTQVKESSRFFYIVVLAGFLIGASASLHAIFTQKELFNWDNQAGLIVLFLLAMIPIMVLSLQQKNLLQTLSLHTGGIRTASLSPLQLRNLLPKPLIILIIGLQFIFIGTVQYFVNHPFEGFAGYTNLFGLLMLDLIFCFVTWAIYRSKKLNAIQIPQQRNAIKSRAIRINMLIWALALFQITQSMWTSGMELDSLKLVFQSAYLQIIILLSAFTLALPTPEIDADK